MTPPFLTVRRRFWRMLAPKWAHAPLSGAGAARRGGRYNEPGCPALYMSEEFVTAMAEYQQDLGVRPGTLCAYDVDATAVADLTDPAVRAAYGVSGEDLTCPWKSIAFVQKREPPSWILARRLAAVGIGGVRVPSVQATAGTNLVLWRWNQSDDCRVVVLDPLGDLPRSDGFDRR